MGGRPSAEPFVGILSRGPWRKRILSGLEKVFTAAGIAYVNDPVLGVNFRREMPKVRNNAYVAGTVDRTIQAGSANEG